MSHFRLFSRTFLLLTITALSLAASATGATVKVVRDARDWVLLVDGEPYFIRGVVYSPAKVGEDPNNATLRDWMVVDDNNNGRVDAAYDTFLDVNLNNQQDPNEPAEGDFSLMKKMGVNTIRLYHHASDAPEVQGGYGGAASQLVQYNHPPNKEVLRDLYRTYGIRVAVGDFFGAYTTGSGAPWIGGTDYRNPVHRANMRASVRQMVLDFKDEEFLLMYILGNENNYAQYTNTNAGQFPIEYARFVEEMAQMIHDMDPNHPVAISHGDVVQIDFLARYAPSLDIFGCNSYRGVGFGNLWEQVRAAYDKPVILTEFGDLTPQVSGERLDQVRQRTYHEGSWADIQRHGYLSGPGNALGGFAFNWLDDWWQNGAPSIHNTGPANNEYHGLLGQGDGALSLFLREPRQVYFRYQAVWNAPPTAPSASGDAVVYPNPFQPSQGHTTVTVSMAPAGSKVRVLTVSGELVRELSADPNGRADWPATNQSGEALASGTYFVIVGEGSDSRTLKLAVQR